MSEKNDSTPLWAWIVGAVIAIGVMFIGYRLIQTQQQLEKVAANLKLERNQANKASNELKAELDTTSSEVEGPRGDR